MSTTQKIKEDLQLLKTDIKEYSEGLLDDTIILGEDIKTKLISKLEETKYKTNYVLNEADTAVKRNPYRTAGLAFIVGASIGILLGRKF